MSTRRFGGSVHLCAAVAAFSGASLLAIAAAQAGGFAVREQSALYQGMSFAGAATGDHLSSMFWNSAAAAAVEGFNTETHGSLVVPWREIEATGGDFVDGTNFSGVNPGGFAGDTNSGKIGDPTLVPASYANYQVNENLFLGLATNAQYGFTTKPDNLSFAGTPIATTSEIFSINLNPTVAYKVTPEFTIGVGAQIMYADLRLRSSNAPGPNGGRTTELDDWGFGATAGITWQPTSATSLGLGYRSAVRLDGDGTCTGVGLSTNGADCTGPISAELTLPELVTASVRQNLNERFAVLGTVEWTNWSRLGEQVEFQGAGGNPVDVFPLDYDDGWFFALGAEYAYTPYTTLRAGLAYELSPINDEVRNVSLPDDDRIWLSAGLSTALTENIAIDLAYTHIFVDDSPINIGGGAVLSAEATGDIDIVAASFKYHWGGGEPELEPLK